MTNSDLAAILDRAQHAPGGLSVADVAALECRDLRDAIRAYLASATAWRTVDEADAALARLRAALEDA